MSRCKKCGAESDGRHFCSACRRQWIEKRIKELEKEKS